MKRSIIYLLLLVMLIYPLSAVSAQGNVITMDEAVAMALKSNQNYLIARAETDKADAEVQKATAGALPRLDFGSSYTRNLKVPTVVFGGESFKIGADNTVDVGLNLTQPIWLAGKVFTAMRIARIYKKYTQQMVREVEGEVSYGVRQAFLGAILARDVVRVYEDALATAELNLEIVNKMYSQGVISEYELLRAQVEVANLKPQLTQARNRAQTALDALKNLIGLSLADSLALQYGFDSTTAGQALSIDQVTRAAKENRAALRQHDFLRDISRNAISIAKAGRGFNLIFNSQYGWRYQADNLKFKGSGWTPSWTATLNLTMPLFDGFATSADIKKAKTDYNNAQLSYADLVEQIELEVRQACFNYQETGERLAAQLTTIAQAEEGLKIARLRYQNGVGTQLEILSAETALTQAKTNYVQATHDAALAVYRLLRVTGVDNFDLLKER